MNLEVNGTEPAAIMANFLYQLQEQEYNYKFDPESSSPFSVIVNSLTTTEAKFAEPTEEPAITTMAQVSLLKNVANGP